MISVLTLVKNRETHLRRLIEGLDRSLKQPAELVIVDMSDMSVARPSVRFPIHLLRLDTEGLPLAQARNLAAAQATSEHLLFLDVDCIPSRRLVGTMSETLHRHDALICAEVLYLDADDLGEMPWSEEMLLASGTRHPVRSFPTKGVRPEANAGLFWSLAFGISRYNFHRLGGFDEAFSGYGAEDTDFGFTAREAGIDLLFLGGVPAFHQYHGVTDPPLQHFADIVRNARLFYAKWGKWPMEGWLTQFESMGLIYWTEGLDIVRPPTSAEIAAAAAPAAARF